ncbi:MAG TPA: 2-oxoglutarate dehydrogenase E1 [Bacillota bacterium]|nr:2-oxoglutarate dehydrogenase E1 [Bacillota bacterium]
MKGLTIFQPWASLIAAGDRQFKTLGWYTSYRGPLLIHASSVFPEWARELCYNEPYLSLLASIGFKNPDTLPRGILLAKCILWDCRPFDSRKREWNRIIPIEREEGYVWCFEDLEPLESLILVKGGKGLWNCPDEDFIINRLKCFGP